MRTIKYIVVHATATKENQNFTAQDIDRWHKKRGWSGIGYHYVIDIYGNEEKGRPEWKIGAHVKGFNRNSIGVAYVGGLDQKLAPKDTRNLAQKEALKLRLLHKSEGTPEKIQEILDSFYNEYRYLLNSLYSPKINSENFTDNLIEFINKINEVSNNIIKHSLSFNNTEISQYKNNFYSKLKFAKEYFVK